MNEYNYNSNNTINNDQMNGENMNTPKKPKKHTGAKIVASLMAMVLVFSRFYRSLPRYR